MTTNTNLYCWVDQTQPDPLTVQQGPQRLPQNWQDPETGRWYYNVNNSDIYSDATLISIGWYPYVLSDAGPPVPYSEYYTRSLSELVVTRDVNVVQTAIYTQVDIDSIKNAKESELQLQIPLYDASQVLANSDLQFEVKDVTAWVAESIIDLDDLEVWEDVAAFDTVLPNPIPLDNTYLGERQSEQGTLIVNEERARAISTGAARSSPATNAWLTQCFDAKDDVTGSTPVTDPPAEVRQQVNNPNEYYATAQVNRQEWVDPDPTPGHGIRIKIKPEEGQWRTMVARLYDELGSFVYELPFVEAKPGLWAAETPEAYRVPVAETIMVELGYGSASPFTKKFVIPAAKARVTRKIRYNR